MDGGEGEFHNQSYDLFHMPLRDHASHMFDAYCGHRCPDISIDTGMTSIALILTLLTLRVPESFPLDVMYLFYQGVISIVLVPLLAGKFWNEASTPMNCDNDEMRVPKPVWVHMGRDLAVCVLFYHINLSNI